LDRVDTQQIANEVVAELVDAKSDYELRIGVDFDWEDSGRGRSLIASHVGDLHSSHV
jgi:hypothetical protein